MSELMLAIPVDRPSKPGWPVRWAMPLALLAALFSSTGCSLFPKKKQVRIFVPPPPAPRPNPAAMKPPPIADRPEFAVESSVTLDLSGMASFGFAELIPPPAPVPPPRRPPVIVRAAPPPATVPEPPPVKIAQLLTPEQLRENTRLLDESLDRVQKILDQLAKKNLNGDQREREAQIKELMSQAKEARDQDLVIAVNLAKRADLLSKDLWDHLP